jgi:integrase
MTFLRWAEDEGYAVDPRMRRLKAPRVPLKEATVLHIAQLRDVLAGCNPERPQEELIVRILVGSGVRAAELCGLAVRGPDGLPDLMLDSLDRGRVELRVRWDAGAKGKKSRRVPITAKLAAAIKRYEARHRDPGEAGAKTVSVRAQQWSVDAGAVDRARILRGWTRRDLARHAHVDEGTLCDLFGGRRRPTFGTLRALCHALELALEDVIKFNVDAVRVTIP